MTRYEAHVGIKIYIIFAVFIVNFAAAENDDDICSGTLSFCDNDDCDSGESCQYINGFCQCHIDGPDLNKCFHESSVIMYKSHEYTLAQLLNGEEPECFVPHMPTARGVVISATCTATAEKKQLRLTDTHLVATSNGHQLAHTLRAGDVLFGDFEGVLVCSVLSVAKEEKVEKYFGLNCVHSEVLANGIRTSTFGDFHSLPSWYMYYAGLSLGPEAASRLGDAVADVYFKYA